MIGRNSRVLFVFAVFAASLWLLWPTWQLRQLTPEEASADPERADLIRDKAISLGLDLQGGIHMVLGIKSDNLRHNILVSSNKRTAENFRRELQLAVIDNRVAEDGTAIEIDINPTAAESRWEDIEKAIADIDFLEAPERVTSPERPNVVTVRAALDNAAFGREVGAATGRALEIIRNRIDAFGVREPSIQQAGSGKIVVALPGAADPSRARALIGRTAQLEFHKVHDDNELIRVLRAMDGILNGEVMKVVSTRQLTSERWEVTISPDQREAFAKIIENPGVQDELPADASLFLGSTQEVAGEKRIPLFLLITEASMTGENLEMARVSRDERNRPMVSFEFNSAGAEEFSALTAELSQGQKPLAIVLDGVVQSAPNVQSMIRSNGQITGNYSYEEARDLAVVLRSGALPAPVEVLEDRTVGPSLGSDSIAKGMVAALIGFALVVVYMLVVYKFAGFIADLCVGMNVILVLACLALFKATLTLPGIAAIVLVIGMAVDSNILILERIKEELGVGKRLSAAIDAGYEKAFATILDSNVTTLLTALALFEYGTGPIRGFAVSLSIGILCSMFTAIFVSRMLMDKMVLSAAEPKLTF